MDWNTSKTVSHQIVHDSLAFVIVDDIGDNDQSNANSHHAEAHP
jgi:hypothetical protein